MENNMDIYSTKQLWGKRWTKLYAKKKLWRKVCLLYKQNKTNNKWLYIKITMVFGMD